jgi:hypothetical protein
MIKVLPQYFDLFQYNLEIEHSGVALNFVVDNKTVIDRNNFGQFLLEVNSHATPFVIRNVKYIYSSRLEGQGKHSDFNSWDYSLASYIHKFNTDIDLFGCNYLAISPKSNKQLIIRNKELLFFTKYFENWSIIPLANATNREHIKEYSFFCIILSQYFGFKPNFGQMLATTLILNTISESSKKLPDELQTVREEYELTGILKEFNAVFKYIKNWNMFCYKIYFCHYPQENFTIRINTILDMILTCSRQYEQFNFFKDCYNTRKTQRLLIQTLPFVNSNQVVFDFT